MERFAGGKSFFSRPFAGIGRLMERHPRGLRPNERNSVLPCRIEAVAIEIRRFGLQYSEPMKPVPRSLVILLATLGVLIACGVGLPRTAQALGGRSSSAQSSSASALPNESPAGLDPNSARITITNADDSLDHWSTCIEPACHPGGKGIAVANSQTIGHSDPSIDGSSMLLTVTADSRNFFTNVLWPYKTKGCDDCTQVHTDFQAYPLSSSGVGTLEYDVFLFDATRELNLMWGLQWNQRKKVWQIWDQGGNRWVDTSVTQGPNFGAWNHIQFAGHRVIGENSCKGTECLYYDSLTLNGTNFALNQTEPAGPIHPGWHSIAGFQFQIDAAPVKHGQATVSEYIDQANMQAR